MRLTQLQAILECIYCRQHAFEYVDFDPMDSAKNGIFICRRCRRYYLLENFILDCLPDDIADKARRTAFAQRYRMKFPNNLPLHSEKITAVRLKEQGFTFEEADPSAYDREIVETPFWKQVEGIVLKEWLAGMKNHRDSVILDVGCGTGRVTRRLARQGWEILGTDVTFRMLEIADKQMRPAGRLEGIGFVAADIWHMPFRNSSFSTLVFFGVLHHLNSPYEALQNLQRLLKDKATICGFENNRSIFRSLFDFLMKLKPVWEEDHRLSHPTLSRKSLEEILSLSGFKSNMKTTCFIPPHTYSFLPASIADRIYKMADLFFLNTPLRGNGGLIYFSATRN